MCKQADAAPASSGNDGFRDEGGKHQSRAVGERQGSLAESGRNRGKEIRDHRRHRYGGKGGRSEEAEKEAAATEQIKSLADATPAVAGSAITATATAPGAATAAVSETSKKAEKLAEKADEATAAKTDVKVQLVDYSTQLMGERTALVDRLKLVLDKFEAKGGDGKPYRLYIASIGGIKIDVSDRTATLARISGWLSSDEGGLRLARDVGTFLAYIIGSIIVARIVRMILRRVMSGDHVTSQSAARLHHLVLWARHCRDRLPACIVGARGEPGAPARGDRRGGLRRRLRVAGHAQQFRQRPPHHGVQAVRRRR